MILVLIALITHWRWIFMNEIFSSGDTSQFSWFINTCRDIYSSPSAWTLDTSGSGFGRINFVLSMYPSLSLMYGSLCTFFQSTIIASKLVYLVPMAILSLIGSFMLISYLLKNKTAAIVGALVYGYNVPALVLQTGTAQWAVAYGFTPLILYLFIKSIDNKKLILSLIVGLVGFIAGSYDFRILYIVLWIMLFYVVYKVFSNIKNRNFKRIFSTLMFGIIPFVVMFLLNSFWIMPFYLSDTLFHNVAFDRALFGSHFFYLSHAVTLFHPYWTGESLKVFTVQQIPFYFWLIPNIAALGLIFNYRNKKVWFFAFIAALGILLAKQEDNPFPHLYLWLYNHFPGFNAYREASKFYMLVALGYSVLIGAFVKSLMQIKVSRNYFFYARYLILVVIASVFIWNAKPLFTGEIGRLFNTISLPADYKILAEILENDTQFSRTLWFPALSKWSYFDNLHPRYVIYYDAYAWYLEFKKNPKYKEHVYNTTKVAPDLPWNFEVLNQSFSDNFLDITSTKYIVIPPQYKDTPDDDMFLGTSINDRPFIINFFDNLNFIKRIDIGTKDMVAYENFNYKPLIYITEEMETVYKKVPYKVVDYKYINAAEYTIEIKNINKPLYLNFNNTYAKDWALELEGKHQLSDKDHLQTDMQFNVFYINPTDIIKNYSTESYTKNTDGSINFNLRLYYIPQDLVNIGTYISLATFIGVFIYLIVYILKIVFRAKRLKFKIIGK